MGLKITAVVFLSTMLYLASQGSRVRNIDITENDKRSIEEADRTRQVALLNERDKKREEKSHHPYPKAQRLDDGIQGDRSIMELMEGFRGLL